MILRFGPFAIDPRQRRLFHGAFPVPLASKAFAVLLYLAENSGRIVEKTEILQAVWRNVSVSPPNLTQTVFILREALKRLDPLPYIITIPGRGYQFAAEVKRCRSDSSGIYGRANAHSFTLRNSARAISPVQTTFGNYTGKSLRAVIQQSKRSLQEKPDCASAYVDYATAYCLLVNAGEITSKRAFVAVQDAVLRALELDPEAGAAYAPLGFLRCHFDRDWARAEADFQRALDARPKDLMAFHWYAELLTALQRFDESLAVLRRAQRLYPESVVIQTDIAQTLFHAKEYKDCEAHLLRTLPLGPGFTFANVLLGCTYRLQCRYKEAIRLLEKIASQRTSAVALAMLAASLACSDKTGRAAQILAQLQALRTRCYVSPSMIAFAAASLGKTGIVLEFLEQAERENDYWFLWFRTKSVFDPFQREPRFQKLLKQQGPAILP